jgi:septal ring factor EnvC (AmiA/AmiB activator)
MHFPGDEWPATRGQLRQLEQKMSTQQSAIDALTTQVNTIETQLTSTQADVSNLAGGITSLEASITSLNAEVQKLQNNPNGQVDLTGLTAALGNLQAQAGTLKTAADAAVANLPAAAPPATAPATPPATPTSA